MTHTERMRLRLNYRFALKRIDLLLMNHTNGWISRSAAHDLLVNLQCDVVAEAVAIMNKKATEPKRLKVVA